ncbi:hypothetical protein CN447_29165 [Bacillus thuringiensis]|uniref:aminoacyl--tRNA ligase-related protein n=2 Tax=Bacillus thuringiensis TaxID=1428 RepID=UPI000BF4EA92|nr:aminoacyl--tRNA ligase-related protein [Bacillus thuringiensis]PEW80987.1 hypothetical protein CN447_29165 [Bacillus thuringiensis]
MKVSYSLPEYINDLKLEELLSRAPFLSQDIIYISYKKHNHTIEITFSQESHVDLKVFSETFKSLLKVLQRYKAITPSTIFDNTSDLHLNTEKTDLDLTSKFYTDFELNILDTIDYFLMQIATKYGCLKRKYPSILDKELIDKSGYLKNFPQNIYALFQIPHNYELIDKVRENDVSQINPYFQHSNSYLRPCICYHCYSEFENKTIDSITITSQGQCYRNEISWQRSLSRREEFLMREIIFIGSKDKVLEIRENILNDVWNIFNEFGLFGKITTAKDPFFFYPDLNKGTFQLLSNTKYELIVNNIETEDFSIASFNYCEDHLCKKFNIKNKNNEFLHSGCVAFGLDRWVHALISHHGKKITHYPSKLKEKLIQ